MGGRVQHASDEVLAALTAGVVVVDSYGHLTFANEGATRMLRRSTTELVGARVDDVLLPFATLIEHAESQTSKLAERPETPIVRGDGTQSVVGFSTSRASASGARTILFQELDGVLELRRERDRLLQLAALGDALPSILHELRNPLASITGMLELLVEEATDPLRESLHAILWEVRRIGLTLQGVAVVRPAQGERHAAVDLTVLEACRVLEPTTTRRGVRLEIDVPPMPLLPIDRGVVSGVVFNLVRNAIDACRDGDTIFVRAVLEGDESFDLTVIDTGSGMPSDVLARCRELFFSTKVHGSGIGLAMCQRIAESSKGTLEVDSEPGKGTRVRLTIPLHLRQSEPYPRRYDDVSSR